MSSDIAWAVTRNNSAYLLKKRNCPKPFSTDPLNLTNKHSKRYSGYVNRKAVGIGSAEKGFVLLVKSSRNGNRPAKNVARTEMKKGARTSLAKIRSLIGKNRYRKDLQKAALRRASAVLRSQKPFTAKRGPKGTSAAKKSS